MLTEAEVRRIDERIELQVHRYMEVLYEKHLPRIIQAAVGAHNQDAAAHQGVVRRFERFKFLLIGLAIGCGTAAGAGIAKLLALL